MQDDNGNSSDYKEAMANAMKAPDQINFVIDETTSCRYRLGVQEAVENEKQRIVDHLLQGSDDPLEVFRRTIAALDQADVIHFTLTNMLENLKNNAGDLPTLVERFNTLGLTTIEPRNPAPAQAAPPAHVAREKKGLVTRVVGGVAAAGRAVKKAVTSPGELLQDLLDVLKRFVGSLIKIACLAVRELAKQFKIELKPVIGAVGTKPSFTVTVNVSNVTVKNVEDVLDALFQQVPKAGEVPAGAG